MFTQITLTNYRTHKSTTIMLGPITLLIGNNNSGKTNLLNGIQHFARLIRRTSSVVKPTLKASDYFPDRYRLASNDEPMSISVNWKSPNGEVTYQMELYKKNADESNVACREKIHLKHLSADHFKVISNGFDIVTNVIGLRQKIEEDTTLSDDEKFLCFSFFKDFAYTFSYHLQPSFLKGLVSTHQFKEFDETDNWKEKVSIPAQLGYQGGNLQDMILYAKKDEERTFGRFTALLRRFLAFFNGIRADTERSKTLWELDLGRKVTDKLLDEFDPEMISDGLLKAAAIALLVSLRHPPTLILLEEIENGINPGNLEMLMYWLWQATSVEENRFASQFILTSHSPSVLRAFSERLNNVYVVRLQRRNFRSQVTNLNQALKTLIDIGTLKEEAEIVEENNEQLIKIPKYRLAELWYSGTIG